MKGERSLTLHRVLKISVHVPTLKGKAKTSSYNRPWRLRGGVEVQLYSFFSLTPIWGLVVNTTPRPFYPLVPKKRPCTHCIGDWVGPRAPTRIRSPDRPARSESLYRLHYPDPRRLHYSGTLSDKCEQQVFSNNAVRMLIFTFQSRVHTRTFGPL